MLTATEGVVGVVRRACQERQFLRYALFSPTPGFEFRANVDAAQVTVLHRYIKRGIKGLATLAHQTLKY